MGGFDGYDGWEDPEFWLHKQRVLRHVMRVNREVSQLNIETDGFLGVWSKRDWFDHALDVAVG